MPEKSQKFLMASAGNPTVPNDAPPWQSTAPGLHKTVRSNELPNSNICGRITMVQVEACKGVKTMTARLGDMTRHHRIQDARMGGGLWHCAHWHGRSRHIRWRAFCPPVFNLAEHVKKLGFELKQQYFCRHLRRQIQDSGFKTKTQAC